MRPTIVVRAARVPLSWQKERRTDKIIRVLVFCMEYFLQHLVVPGRAENLNVIVDLQGLSLSHLPVQQLKEVYSVMSRHYLIRVYRFYICNLPTMLSMMIGVARGILSERQQQKLVIIRRVSELQQDFALHQLEADLGGSRPVLQAVDCFPFPLVAGPFTAGYADGPCQEAEAGLRVAPPAGGDLQGEEVEQVAAPAPAAGLPSPRSVLRSAKPGLAVCELDTDDGSVPSALSADCSSQEDDCGMRPLCEEDSDDLGHLGGVELQTTEVVPTRFFECGLCTVTTLHHP